MLAEKKIKEKFATISEEVKPKPNIVKHCFNAFWVGGLICVIGQIIIHFLSKYGFSKEDTGSITSIIMIFLGGLFTGLGEIGRAHV